jgi:hypothetical protein
VISTKKLKPRKIRVCFLKKFPQIQVFDIANGEDVTNYAFNFVFGVPSAKPYQSYVELYASDDQGKKYLPGSQCQVAVEHEAEVVEIVGGWIKPCSQTST